MLLLIRVLLHLVQPERGGLVPAVLFQDLVGRGHGLGGQRVKIHIIIIRVKIPRRIAVQLGQAGGVGQRDRRAQGQRLHLSVSIGIANSLQTPEAEAEALKAYRSALGMKAIRWLMYVQATGI